ncbi:1943_t:CDS:1, partial [Ambispora leptoticha]
RRSEVVAVPGTIRQRQVSVLSKWSERRPRNTAIGHDTKATVCIQNF